MDAIHMTRIPSPRPPEMDRPPTSPRTYSTRPKSIRARIKRLLDDAAADAENARRRRHYAAKVQERLARLASANASLRPSRPFVPTKAMQARVLHHLAKGRDVADIAVRERIKVTVAQRIVEHVRAVQAADPTQDSRRPREAGRD